MYRKIEKAVSEIVTARLDLFRDLRDAAMEALFFEIYGPPAVSGVVESAAADRTAAVTDPRVAAGAQSAGSDRHGGYPEAVALMAALIGKAAGRIPLVNCSSSNNSCAATKGSVEFPAMKCDASNPSRPSWRNWNRSAVWNRCPSCWPTGPIAVGRDAFGRCGRHGRSDARTTCDGRSRVLRFIRGGGHARRGVQNGVSPQPVAAT